MHMEGSGSCRMGMKEGRNKIVGLTKRKSEGIAKVGGKKREGRRKRVKVRRESEKGIEERKEGSRVKGGEGQLANVEDELGGL